MIANIKKDLKKAARQDKANTLQRFFKTGPGQYGEGDKFIGVMVPDIRRVSQKYKDLPTKEVLDLLRSPFHEERLCALLILVDQYQKGDSQKQKQIFALYLKNYQYINNWDLIDLTAPRIVGAYLMHRPKDVLYKLAKSKNLWQRRVAILATFQFIYAGQSQETIKIAKILLRDEHDLIQKAVGWMLREVGKRCDEKILLDFLDEYHKVMPRTMLRYAIERLPTKKRQHYLGKKNLLKNYLAGLILFFMFGPVSSQAMGELMVFPKDYNVDHTVKAGSIWTIPKLLLVNLGQRDVDVTLQFFRDSNRQNTLALDVDELELEMGKAQNVDLLVTTPLDMPAGYHKGQLLVSIPDDRVAKIEGSEYLVNVNFVVEKANFIQALWYRLISEYQHRDLTFYLASILFFSWFLFFVWLFYHKIKKNLKQNF